MKHIVGENDLARLQEAKAAGPDALRHAAAEMAEPLVNSASAYRGLRSEIRSVLKDMRDVKGVEEKHVAFDAALKRLQDALDIEIR